MADLNATYELLTTDKRFYPNFETLQKRVLTNIRPSAYDTSAYPLVPGQGDAEVKQKIGRCFYRLFSYISPVTEEQAAQYIITSFLGMAMLDAVAKTFVAKDSLHPTDSECYDAVMKTGQNISISIGPVLCSETYLSGNIYLRKVTRSPRGNISSLFGLIDVTFFMGGEDSITTTLGNNLKDRQVTIKLASAVDVTNPLKTTTVALKDFSKKLFIDLAKECASLLDR